MQARRRTFFATAAVTSMALGATLLAGCAGSPAAPDAATLIARAEQALGSSAATTLSVTARGSGSNFGQAYQANNTWPALNYSVLTRAFDFETGAMREEFGRSRTEPNGGGAVPLMARARRGPWPSCARASRGVSPGPPPRRHRRTCNHGSTTCGCPRRKAP